MFEFFFWCSVLNRQSPYAKSHIIMRYCEVISRDWIVKYISLWNLAGRSVSGDTVRNNDVVITPKRRHFDVITSKWRRFDVITTLSLRHVFSEAVR